MRAMANEVPPAPRESALLPRRICAAAPAEIRSRRSAAMEGYRVLRKLGEGAFGEVLLAVDKKRGRRVAIKRIHMRSVSETVALTALRELRALQYLSHDNVRIRAPLAQDAYAMTQFGAARRS